MTTHWMTIGMALMAGAGAAGSATAQPPPGRLEPVTIEERPALRVAYVEQVGNFQANPGIYDVLLEQLLAWAIPANRWDFPAKTQIACIYPDDPETTPPDRQRLWLGITIDEHAAPPEPIRTLTLPAGLHAVGRFSVPSDQFGLAWGYMYGEWMAQSGHLPAGLAFEIQWNDSSEDPEQKHRIDICIPVRPLPDP